MAKNLIKTKSRWYESETHTRIEIKVVLSLGQDEKIRGFIGEGSDMFVADRGRKLSYDEVILYFPEMTKEQYGYN